MTAVFAILPIDFNIAYSIGFVIGIGFTLWRFQRGETLGLPPTGWRTILTTVASCVVLVLVAPTYVTAGIAAGFFSGVIWVALAIHAYL